MTTLPPMTEDEIEQLAIEIVTNVVYVPRTAEALDCSFGGILALLGDKLPDNVGGVYERYDQAGSRAVNGYPMFFRYGRAAGW